MKPLVISCSLNPTSLSAQLAAYAHRTMLKDHPESQWVDLRELELPMCDGGAAYQHTGVAPLSALIAAADPILLTAPVYNFDANAAAKNLIELTGKAWSGKVVGFLCAAGGRSSYMSLMSIANSLMLDFRCVIVPRFVYATGDDFNGDRTPSDSITPRTDELCQASVSLARAMASVGSSGGGVG